MRSSLNVYRSKKKNGTERKLQRKINCGVCLSFMNWKCRAVVVKVPKFFIHFLRISSILSVWSEWDKGKNIPWQSYINTLQDLGHNAAVVCGIEILLSVCIIWNRIFFFSSFPYWYLVSELCVIERKMQWTHIVIYYAICQGGRDIKHIVMRIFRTNYMCLFIMRSVLTDIFCPGLK